MTKTISELAGSIGDKKIRNFKKKDLGKSVKSALLSSVALMKDAMGSPEPKRISLCLDLKRKLEEVEKEFNVTLI